MLNIQGLPTINLLVEAEHHAEVLADDKVAILRLGNCVPCGLCKNSTPFEPEEFMICKWYYCKSKQILISEFIIHCCCAEAQLALVNEGVDTLQLSRPDSDTLWADYLTRAQQEAEEQEFGRGGYKYCGQLSLRPQGAK